MHCTKRHNNVKKHSLGYRYSVAYTTILIPRLFHPHQHFPFSSSFFFLAFEPMKFLQKNEREQLNLHNKNKKAAKDLVPRSDYNLFLSLIWFSLSCEGLKIGDIFSGYHGHVWTMFGHEFRSFVCLWFLLVCFVWRWCIWQMY